MKSKNGTFEQKRSLVVKSADTLRELADFIEELQKHIP